MRMQAIGVLLALAWPSVSGAVSLAEGQRCLAANDIPCAQTVVDELDATQSVDPEVLAFAAATAFYGGQFRPAHELLDRAVQKGWEDRWGELGLYQRTLDVHQDFVEVQRGHFTIRYRPGLDAVMIDDAFEALERTEKNVLPLLGELPPGNVALEIYPDGRTFIDCSSLSKEAVETTGVVALSKWSRLLLTSPRALGRGYDWQNTVSHEFIHLVVAHNTDDQSPVWLQEAIAKYLDHRWPDGTERFQVEVRSQALLAEAVKNDRFVPFDKMHPSLALLDSADEAALAYAQLATMMDFAFEKGGDDVLTRILPRVRRGEDPRVAMADEAGFKRFEQFEVEWRKYVATLKLVERRLAEMPTVLDGGDAMDTDPLLSKRRDLAGLVRVGDLLQEKKRYEAALVEYAKAVPEEEPQSPLLSNRVAAAWLALDKPASAKSALLQSLVDYPEYALTYETLGDIYRKEGNPAQALQAYEQARALDPFRVRVQTSLQDLSSTTGDARNAARYGRYVQILRQGGEMLGKTEPAAPR